MKKLLLCFVLLLGGCKDGYIMKRNPESDVIKIGLVVMEKDKHIIEGLNLNVQLSYVCNMDCKSRFEDLEAEYVDGIILIGEEVNQQFEQFENKNHIPVVSVYKQNPLYTLRIMYPEYEKWVHVVTDEMVNSEADAYYVNEGIDIETDKPFYQKNNSQSMCVLIEDKYKFQDDLNSRIQNFIDVNNNDSTLFIEWIKK